MSDTTYEWVTTFVVRHHAGSFEGAIFQRNEYERAIADQQAEVVMASTRPGDASEEALDALEREIDRPPDET